MIRPPYPKWLPPKYGPARRIPSVWRRLHQPMHTRHAGYGAPRTPAWHPPIVAELAPVCRTPFVGFDLLERC